MKTATLPYYAFILLTIGFVLMNGYHNFLAVLFVLALTLVFLVVPMLIRIKYFIKHFMHSAPIHKQWA